LRRQPKWRWLALRRLGADQVADQRRDARLEALKLNAEVTFGPMAAFADGPIIGGEPSLEVANASYERFTDVVATIVVNGGRREHHIVVLEPAQGLDP
jgi:hypothetical protein